MPLDCVLATLLICKYRESGEAGNLFLIFISKACVAWCGVVHRLAAETATKKKATGTETYSYCCCDVLYFDITWRGLMERINFTRSSGLPSTLPCLARALPPSPTSLTVQRVPQNSLLARLVPPDAGLSLCRREYGWSGRGVARGGVGGAGWAGRGRARWVTCN